MQQSIGPCLLFNTCLQTKTHLGLQNDYLKHAVTAVQAFAFEQQTLSQPLSACVSPGGPSVTVKVSVPRSDENTSERRKTKHLSPTAVICRVIVYESGRL